MDIEDALRAALSELADDTVPGSGLAAIAIRRARRRQYAARTAVASTAAAVTIPVSIAALDDFGPGSSVSPGMSGPAAQPSVTENGTEPAQTSIVAAPPARELDEDELAEAFETCAGGVDGDGEAAESGWQPAFGITIEAEAEPGVPTTWVAARRGEDYRADCALDASGALVNGGFDTGYGVKSTPALLYALVDGQQSSSGGRYVAPVATVTVQYDDGPEQAAVMHGGFWFFPMDDNRYFWENFDDGATPEEIEQRDPAVGGLDLIGVPVGYVFRGYDSTGTLLYDSSTDGPSVEDCYADPSGTEFVGSFAGHSDPSECVLTHQWEPID